jgi:FkbM family methyltransferase
MKDWLFRSLRTALAHLPVPWFRKVPGAAAIYTAVYRKLKPHGIEELECLGLRMLVHTHDEGVARQLMIKGIYEELETEFFLAWLKPGMGVLDLGANFGYFTLIASKVVGPTGRVFAFEPEPGNRALLEKNIAFNGFSQARALPFAVSDKAGSLRLFVDSANLGNPSIAQGNVPSKAGFVDVRTISVDEFFSTEGDVPPRIDLVKMDVQGAEALVIRGATELLARDRPLLLIELWPLGLRNVGTDPLAFLKELEALGYSARRITRDGTSGEKLGAEEIVRICDRREEGETFINLLFEHAGAKSARRDTNLEALPR